MAVESWVISKLTSCQCLPTGETFTSSTIGESLLQFKTPHSPHPNEITGQLIQLEKSDIVNWTDILDTFTTL